MILVPRLMGAARAAMYLGISETTLRAMKVRRRKLGRRYLYDRHDLDVVADEIPFEKIKGETMGGARDTCDEAFDCGA